MYETENLTQSQTFSELVIALNHSSDYTIGLLLLISVFIIMFFSSRNDLAKSFAMSSFVTFTTGLLLRITDLITNEILLTLLLLLGVSIAVLFASRTTTIRPQR